MSRLCLAVRLCTYCCPLPVVCWYLPQLHSVAGSSAGSCQHAAAALSAAGEQQHSLHLWLRTGPFRGFQLPAHLLALIINLATYRAMQYLLLCEPVQLGCSLLFLPGHSCCHLLGLAQLQGHPVLASNSLCSQPAPSKHVAGVQCCVCDTSRADHLTGTRSGSGSTEVRLQCQQLLARQHQAICTACQQRWAGQATVRKVRPAREWHSQVAPAVQDGLDVCLHLPQLLLAPCDVCLHTHSSRHSKVETSRCRVQQPSWSCMRPSPKLVLTPPPARHVRTACWLPAVGCSEGAGRPTAATHAWHTSITSSP